MKVTNKVQIISLTGNLRQGGYVVSARIDNDTDAISLNQNIQIRAKSGTGFIDSDWREIFNGHAIGAPDNLQVSRYNSQAQIQPATMDAIMAGFELQDIGFTEQASPANDHQITGLQLADIVNHILTAHCNVVYNATTMPDGVITSKTIDTTNSTAVARYNVRKSMNMWRSLQQIGGGEDGGEFFRCWFNRRNQFYYQAAPAFWSTPPTSLGTITKDHLRGTMRVKRNNNQPGQQVGQVDLTAVKNATTVYTSKYPTNPGDGRILPLNRGIFAESQARADELSQYLFQWLTRNYTVTIELDPAMILLGDDGLGIDLANKVTLNYNGPVEDATTGHGFHINFSSQDFFVYGVQINFDTSGKAAQGFLTLEQDPT